MILVDIQNDFLPGGALPAPHGDAIAPFVSRLIHHFDRVIATKDWHVAGDRSFAVFGPHCIEGSWGAEHPLWLDPTKIAKTILKESFSGFSTGELEKILRRWGVTQVVICGLVTDICVKETALDACRLGFRTSVVRDASSSLKGEDEAIAEMEAAGVKFYMTEEMVA